MKLLIDFDLLIFTLGDGQINPLDARRMAVGERGSAERRCRAGEPLVGRPVVEFGAQALDCNSTIHLWTDTSSCLSFDYLESSATGSSAKRPKRWSVVGASSSEAPDSRHRNLRIRPLRRPLQKGKKKKKHGPMEFGNE